MTQFIKTIERTGRYEVALTDRGFIVLDTASADDAENHVVVAGVYAARFKAQQKAAELEAQAS